MWEQRQDQVQDIISLRCEYDEQFVIYAFKVGSI